MMRRGQGILSRPRWIIPNPPPTIIQSDGPRPLWPRISLSFLGSSL